MLVENMISNIQNSNCDYSLYRLIQFIYYCLFRNINYADMMRHGATEYSEFGDLVSYIYLCIMHVIHKINHDNFVIRDFINYLISAVKNELCKSYRRNKYHIKYLELNNQWSEEGLVSDSSWMNDYKYEMHKEIYKDIYMQEILLEMNDIQRQIFCLRVKGYEFKEIAKILNLKIITITDQYYRIKQNKKIYKNFVLLTELSS